MHRLGPYPRSKFDPKKEHPSLCINFKIKIDLKSQILTQLLCNKIVFLKIKFLKI